MLQRYDLVQITGAAQSRDHENEQRHRTASGPGENVNAEHGRKPLVVQTHQPIEGPESEAKGKHRQAGKGDLAHPNGMAGISISILLNGMAAQQLGGDDEQSEKENRAEEKEFPVQISALGIERWFMTRRNVHPLIKMM